MILPSVRFGWDYGCDFTVFVFWVCLLVDSVVCIICCLNEVGCLDMLVGVFGSD